MCFERIPAKARDEAAETLRTVYAEAVAEVRDALLMVKDAKAKVIAANQHKPDGTEQIVGAGPEATAPSARRPPTR